MAGGVVVVGNAGAEDVAVKREFACSFRYGGVAREGQNDDGNDDGYMRSVIRVAVRGQETEQKPRDIRRSAGH